MSFATSGEITGCSFDDLLNFGLLYKAHDIFIACDRLSCKGSIDGFLAERLLSKATDVKYSKLEKGHDQMMMMMIQDKRQLNGISSSSSSEILIRYKEDLIAIEKIGLYKKTTVTSSQAKGELRIVSRS